MIRFVQLTGLSGLLLASGICQGQTPRFCLTYGPRAGILSENFSPAKGQEWNGRPSARLGYSGDVFGELSSPTGKVRLRTELAYASHRQHYTAHPGQLNAIDLTYNARELQLTPLLLVWVQRSPVCVLAGVELTHALAGSRVRGFQVRELGFNDYETVAINNAYRSSANLDARLTLGASAYIRERFDITLRGNIGLGKGFKVYAPGTSGNAFHLFRSSTPAQQAADAGETGYRDARFAGIALSVGYHFGNPPIRPTKSAPTGTSH